ncbi:MAG TPA: glutamine amidotransferase [Steroidobacteraceae bacterium]|jgi:GMP synthase (glutamine-hydrolysing)
MGSAETAGVEVLSRTRLALAIRHVNFEDCGSLADVLARRDFTLRYIEAGRDSLAEIDAQSADILIGLGGPVSVYDPDRYPWIREELAVFERFLALNKPILGICLGAQMLARALGARVYPGPVKELGWKPLSLTSAGRSSAAASLDGTVTSMLHWHGDTFDLPSEADLLASTPDVTNQIFQWRRTIGFQCHPEIQAGAFESWLIGHACEIDATPGVSVEQLRRDTSELAPTLAVAARKTFDSWLTQVRL